jgi:hypothetical protein
MLMIVAAIFADRPAMVRLGLSSLFSPWRCCWCSCNSCLCLPDCGKRYPAAAFHAGCGGQRTAPAMASTGDRSGAAINAAASLVVPIATLIFVLGLKEAERSLLPGILLGFVAASMLLGLVQFSRAGMDNP